MAIRDVVFWSIAVGVFLVDRLTKLLVLAYVPVNSSVQVFPFLSITHVLNTGTAFGLLKQGGFVFGLFALIVSVYVICAYRRQKTVMVVLFALILAGALGNLTDRLLYGSVIDFVDVHVWPVFNVADSAISIAVVVLLCYEFFVRKHVQSQRKV